MVLLDWEKAFDKVKHPKVFEARQRMGVDDKLIRIVKSIYKNITFKLKMNEEESDWKKQES